MNKKEMILISKMLEVAAEIFSNHGCNDIPDSWLNKWNKKDKKLLLRDIIDILDMYNDDNNKFEFNMITDNMLMLLYSKKLSNEAKKIV